MESIDWDEVDDRPHWTESDDVQSPAPSPTPIPEKLGVLGAATEGRGGEE